MSQTESLSFSDAAKVQQERYELHMRRMQTGVAMLMQHSPRDPGTEPKHLRVGVNGALVDSSALGTLLISKGIITDVEYFTALADGAQVEADGYEKRVADLIGGPVTLGPAGSL